MIAIAGEFRKGKSFLLNFFLRYLRFLRDNDGHGDWLDPAVPLANEFSWKRSHKRHTNGIQIWPEPFFVRDKNGEEIVVLLADTQGTFDLQSSAKDNAIIFSFATLVSSTLVGHTFNSSHLLNTYCQSSQNLKILSKNCKTIRKKSF